MYKPIVLILMILGSTFAARQINGDGLKLIKSFEGFRSNFYKDAVGIKTIGYGHACHANDCSHIHPPISEAQGSALLLQDLAGFENCVDGALPHLDNDKFSALVSFAFNLGCGALRSSTLAKYVREHNYRAAANEFHLWVHAGGRVLPGLVKRRAAERALFCRSGGC